MRNEPDNGATSEGAVITYSRLPPRDGDGSAERQEPFLDAREVPYAADDLRAYDPERAAGGALDAAIDDLDKPRRGPGKRRRGGFGVVLLGAVALAAGMVILAYAYGIATRLDTPSPSSAGAAAPQGAEVTPATSPADDAARSVPVTGAAPAADSAAPGPAAAADDTSAAPSQAQPEPAASASATAPATAGSDGAPMDGDSGARPALVAPVPVTTTPAAAETAAPATARAEPPPAQAASAPPANAKPADSSDELMANIERLLAHDAATAGPSAQPVAGPAATAAPTPLVPPQQPEGANALPQLPDANAVADAPAPPADVGLPLRKRLIPPADIPNVAPNDLGTGAQ